MKQHASIGLRMIILPLLCVWGSTKSYSQIMAVKNNVLYDAMASLNLAGEYCFDYNKTVQIAVSYNPWEWGDNKKMKHLLIQPEVRYWLSDVFFGMFVGIETHYAMYNFGGMTPFKELKRHRYQGDIYGAGITLGYQWWLGKRWGLEASIGLGYSYVNYKKYGPKAGDYLIKQSNTGFFGPTQAGLSIVYYLR